ncbi:reverse transcriptase domain-containing protein [Tanacetum coccineum]
METFLQTLDEFTDLDNDFYDTKRDILYLEQWLNEDPSPKKNEELKEVTKAKPSIEEPPELELKDLPSHLEYAYLEKNDKLPVIIAKGLKDDEKEALLKVLKSHKRAIAWKISDIKGINPHFCTHKLLMEDDYKPTVQSQRWVNLKIHKVIKKEVLKLLDSGMIYPISDSPWVSPVHCVPKKGGITIVANEENELIPTRLVTGWRVCIDYRKLNEATRKDHFPLPFMDQMLERLAGNEFYCFLDGFSGYFQIPIDPQDQENTTFTCPYGTFAYRRMPFGLCNAPGTFQRCMMAIFHDMIEKTMEVFMDDFSVFGDSFDSCLSNLENMLKRPMTHLLEKETPFVFSKDCINDFQTLKKKLTEAPILVVLDWNLPFELMCDASDFAIGVVLGQRRSKHFQPIHYASKTMTEAQIHYTTTEKEMLAIVYAFEKFRPYLIRSVLEKENRASWSDKLDEALWAFRTAFKTPIGCTPYNYAEFFDLIERTKKLHDSKDQKTAFYNVGSFTITNVIYLRDNIELSQPDGPNFKELVGGGLGRWSDFWVVLGVGVVGGGVRSVCKCVDGGASGWWTVRRVEVDGRC